MRTLREERGSGSNLSAISLIRALREAGHTLTVHAYSSSGNRPPSDISYIEHGAEQKSFTQGNHYLADLLRQYQGGADLFFLYGHDFMWGGGEYRKRTQGSIPIVVFLDRYPSSMGLIYIDSDSQALLDRFMTFVWTFVYRMKRLVWEKLLGMKYIKFVDQFLPISPYMVDVYARFGFPREKFTPVPNFFEMPKEKTPRVVSNSRPVQILYTGRFAYDKGIDLLLQALAAIESKNWNLRLVGDGPLKTTYVQMVKSLGLETRVVFIPWLSSQKLTEEYERADVFVHPARWPETFGRTIVEAIMHGLPVIVPSEGAPAWIAGDAGVQFSNGNVKELQVAVEKLIANSALRQDLSEKGKIRARAFTKEIVLPQLESILQRIVYPNIKN